ncbi:MAG: hypothetical protein ACE5DI_05995, partial [Candidatus Micrarchaeia archaeon]
TCKRFFSTLAFSTLCTNFHQITVTFFQVDTVLTVALVIISTEATNKKQGGFFKNGFGRVGVG